MIRKYIKAYELCGDVLHDDDPRRGEIIAEMKAVEKAATIDEAAAVVEWWGWGRPRPTDRHKTAKDFCEDVRRFLAQVKERRVMSEPVLYAIQWDEDDNPDERFVWADRKCVDNYLGRAVPRGRLVPLYVNAALQWISVNERLPKNGTSFLASDGRTVVQMSYFHAYGFECVGGDEPVFTPTHWMPLPPPPVDAHTQPQQR